MKKKKKKKKTSIRAKEIPRLKVIKCNSSDVKETEVFENGADNCFHICQLPLVSVFIFIFMACFKRIQAAHIDTHAHRH